MTNGTCHVEFIGGPLDGQRVRVANPPPPEFVCAIVAVNPPPPKDAAISQDCPTSYNAAYRYAGERRYVFAEYRERP